MDNMIRTLGTLGTIAFSISGAIAAMKKEMDLLGVIVLGVIAALGGGVTRDVLTGQIPPSVFQDSGQAKLAVVAAIVTFIVGAVITKYHCFSGGKWWNKVLFFSDAIGLAAFTILGIRCVEERMGSDSIALLIFVGVMTSVGGGLLRDLLSGEIPFIFQKHVYATASFLGAILYLTLRWALADWQGGGWVATVISILWVITLRILSAYYGWNLPRVRLVQGAPFQVELSEETGEKDLQAKAD